MNFILLSGGSGKRLWPLSNDVRSKQFLKILKNEQGEYESMVQRVYRQIRAAVPEANVTVATGKKQVSALVNQLGDKISICVEPARRDTFPAIALAAAYLACEKAFLRTKRWLFARWTRMWTQNIFLQSAAWLPRQKRGTVTCIFWG